MGLYLKGENKFYVLKLRENVDDILNEYKVPEVLKTLDLIVLHKAIISKELGYTQEEQMAQDGILYIKQEEESKRKKKKFKISDLMFFSWFLGQILLIIYFDFSIYYE